MTQTKLIVLRGPSGSGKSTVANNLFASAVKMTALIEQDRYRFIFNPAGGGGEYNSDTTIHKINKGDALIALQDGSDIILEDLLSVRSYGRQLGEIFKSHPGENYVY